MDIKDTEPQREKTALLCREHFCAVSTSTWLLSVKPDSPKKETSVKSDPTIQSLIKRKLINFTTRKIEALNQFWVFTISTKKLFSEYFIAPWDKLSYKILFWLFQAWIFSISLAFSCYSLVELFNQCFSWQSCHRQNHELSRCIYRIHTKLEIYWLLFWFVINEVSQNKWILISQWHFSYYYHYNKFKLQT